MTVVNERDKMLAAESPRFTTGGVAPADLTVATGTVDTPQINPAAVTTPIIAANAVTVNQVVTGSSTLTGATATTGGSTGTPATILTLTLTVAYAGYFLASFACRQGSNLGPKPWTMSLNFDGTPVFATGGGVLGATGYAFTDSVAMAGAAFLAAGSHTVDVVWTGDTTMEIDARTLSVVSAMK